jgi:recombination protein RecR
MAYAMIGLPSLERMVTVLTRFPGVGRKSAQRMAFHLLRRGPEEIGQFVDALTALRANVRLCTLCHNLAEGEYCWVCADPRRDLTMLCVVEESADLMAIDRAGLFRGRYHVLGGRLSPLDGVGPDALHLDTLERRLRDGHVQEVVLATNPTVEGEATAHYVARIAQPHVARVTRLAYGLPMGGELEYLDESTLYQALAGRRNYG